MITREQDAKNKCRIAARQIADAINDDQMKGSIMVLWPMTLKCQDGIGDYEFEFAELLQNP